MTTIDNETAYLLGAWFGTLISDSDVDPDEVLARVAFRLAQHDSPKNAVLIANIVTYAVTDHEPDNPDIKFESRSKRRITSVLEKYFPSSDKSVIARGIADAKAAFVNLQGFEDLKQRFDDEVLRLWEAKHGEADGVHETTISEWAAAQPPSHPAFLAQQNAKACDKLFWVALTLPINAVKRDGKLFVQEFGSTIDLTLEDMEKATFGMISSDELEEKIKASALVKSRV